MVTDVRIRPGTMVRVYVEGVGMVVSVDTDRNYDGSVTVSIVDDINDEIIYENTLEKL